MQAGTRKNCVHQRRTWMPNMNAEHDALLYISATSEYTEHMPVLLSHSKGTCRQKLAACLIPF